MTGESGRTLLNFTHAGRELGCEAYSVKLTEEDGGYVLSAKLRRRDGSGCRRNSRTPLCRNYTVSYGRGLTRSGDFSGTADSTRGCRAFCSAGS